MQLNQENSSLYLDEWITLFSKNHYLDQLKRSATKGYFKTSHFRSICWKLFLGCLPENKAEWIDTSKAQRQQYDEILDQFATNPRSVDTLDINVNNPLSQSQQSPWNQYFQDNDLKVTIQQDVVRTFPEIHFFRSLNIQNLMTNILFNYARKYPHISYKQGMHELLAPILFVLHYDQQSYLHASETEKLDLEIHILLNQNYMEHDAFFLFCCLMKRVEAWYTVESPYSEQVSCLSREPLQEKSTFGVLSLPDTLQFISKVYLKRIDNELFCHLERMEITPQIYGIRWLRLLFGREFSLYDLLILWDAIFADSEEDFVLVDYIFVAMLNSIRDLLLQGDYASCLKYLMRYPLVEDVQHIIILALHFRDPYHYKRPESSSKKVLNRLASKENKQIGSKSLSKTSTGSVKAQNISNKCLESRPKSLSIVKLWNNVADLSPSGSQSKSSSEQILNTVSSDINESDDSLDFLNSAISYNTNIGASSTLPRTSIRNVMESRNHKFRADDLTQILDKNIPSEKSCREMDLLLLPSTDTTHKILQDFGKLPKEIDDEIKVLKTEISTLKLMNEYCTQQITKHLAILQECMTKQRLQNEDRLFLALAGIKRARDILDGTFNFTEDIIDEDISLYNVLSQSHKHSTEISLKNKVSSAKILKDLQQNLKCDSASKCEDENISSIFSRRTSI